MVIGKAITTVLALYCNKKYYCNININKNLLILNIQTVVIGKVINAFLALYCTITNSQCKIGKINNQNLKTMLRQ